ENRGIDVDCNGSIDLLCFYSVILCRKKGSKLAYMLLGVLCRGLCFRCESILALNQTIPH
ncbi:hypothetical protein TGAM01_v201251, partial [Trichoderma gamsii]